GGTARVDDDVLFQITANNSGSLTVLPSLGGETLTDVAMSGDTARFVAIFDNLEIRGRGVLDSTGHDLLILNGDLSSGDTTTFHLNGVLKVETLDLGNATTLILGPNGN